MMITPTQHVTRLLIAGKLRPHIIFDKDGTLTGCLVEGRPPNKLAEQFMLPNVVEICKVLRKLNYSLSIASNQGGVAYGFMSFATAYDLVAAAANAIGAVHYAICPHHPKGTNPKYALDCVCRKPKPGMILRLLGTQAMNALFVGDWDSDKEAAEAAGCEFIWAKDFFGWGEVASEPTQEKGDEDGN